MFHIVYDLQRVQNELQQTHQLAGFGWQEGLVWAIHYLKFEGVAVASVFCCFKYRFLPEVSRWSERFESESSSYSSSSSIVFTGFCLTYWSKVVASIALEAFLTKRWAISSFAVNVIATKLNLALGCRTHLWCFSFGLRWDGLTSLGFLGGLSWTRLSLLQICFLLFLESLPSVATSPFVWVSLPFKSFSLMPITSLSRISSSVNAPELHEEASFCSRSMNATTLSSWLWTQLLKTYLSYTTFHWGLK